MAKGVIKFFNAEKGYGFIKVQGQKDVFVHKTGLDHGYMPEEEDYVQFDVRQTEKGLQAENVCKC